MSNAGRHTIVVSMAVVFDMTQTTDTTRYSESMSIATGSKNLA
jgi:hypothetical protein